MEMNYINDQFITGVHMGVPAPNRRQWLTLLDQLSNQLGTIADQPTSDPKNYRDRAMEFAGTMTGQSSVKFLDLFDQGAAQIRVARKRAQRLVDNYTDHEFEVAFGTYMPVSSHKETVVNLALGSHLRTWRYKDRPEDNEILARAWDLGEKQAWTRSKTVLPKAGPQELWDIYNAHDYNSRKKAEKAAWDTFSKAMWHIQENVVVHDRLFSERFRIIWELAGDRVRYDGLAAKLTKPLEEYACRYGNRWSKHIEYGHKGAEATWQALLRVQRLEEQLEENIKRLETPGWDIDSLVIDALSALSVLKVICAETLKDRAKKQALALERERKKQEKIDKQKKLAGKPIVIQTVIRKSGMWINQLELRRGLTGRHGWLSLNGHEIPIVQFRKWLDLVLKGDNNRRVRSLDQADWVQLDGQAETALWETVPYVRHREVDRVNAVRLWTNGSFRVTAHFIDQHEHIEAQENSGNEQIVHSVQFKTVEDTVHRTVWTPEDINKYRPSVVAQA